MTKLFNSAVAVLFGLALLSSCNKDEALDPQLSGTSDVTLEERARNASVSGHVELDSVGGRMQRYSFTAVQHKNGTVKGEFQLFDILNDSTTVVIHGDVECFTIQEDGITAWVGGVIERGMVDSVSLVGAEAYWTVVDNGQGGNADPDEATEIAYGFEGVLADDHCAEGLGTFVYFGPIVRANVKVKP